MLRRLACCINIVCSTGLQDDDEPHWLGTARSRRTKRKWIRSSKGRLTPGARIRTKQLKSLQGKGIGVLPMHTHDKAGQPSVQHDYTTKNTWGYKVFDIFLKIVGICKYYTSGGETTVVQPANRLAGIHMCNDAAERHSHGVHSNTAERHVASKSDEGDKKIAYLNHCANNIFDENLQLNTVPYDPQRSEVQNTKWQTALSKSLAKPQWIQARRKFVEYLLEDNPEEDFDSRGEKNSKDFRENLTGYDSGYTLQDGTAVQLESCSDASNSDLKHICEGAGGAPPLFGVQAGRPGNGARAVAPRRAVRRQLQHDMEPDRLGKLNKGSTMFDSATAPSDGAHKDTFDYKGEEPSIRHCNSTADKCDGCNTSGDVAHACPDDRLTNVDVIPTLPAMHFLSTVHVCDRSHFASRVATSAPSCETGSVDGRNEDDGDEQDSDLLPPVSGTLFSCGLRFFENAP